MSGYRTIVYSARAHAGRAYGLMCIYEDESCGYSQKEKLKPERFRCGLHIDLCWL